MESDGGTFDASISQLQKKPPAKCSSCARHFRCAGLQRVNVLVVPEPPRRGEITVTDRLSDAINQVEKLGPALREFQLPQARYPLVLLKHLAMEAASEIEDRGLSEQIPDFRSRFGQ